MLFRSGDRDDAFLNNDEDSHHTAHQELVLLDLLWCWVFLNEVEEMIKEVLSEWKDLLLAKHAVACSIGEGQHTLDGDGGVCVDDVIVGSQVLHEWWKSTLPLLLRQLGSESVEVVDGVDLEDWLDVCAGEIAGNVVCEELDDVDEFVGCLNALGCGDSSTGSDGGEEVDSGVLGLPLVLWVLGVLCEDRKSVV